MIKKVNLPKELIKKKVNLNSISEYLRPTTNKNSYIVDNHKLLKVDELVNSTILDNTIDFVAEKSIKKKIN